MIVLVAVIALSALLAWFVTGFVIRYAGYFRLVQIPNSRSSHVTPTPSGGGLGFIVSASLVGLAWTIYSSWVVGFVLLILALVVAFVGLTDDVRPLSAKLRFSIQLALGAGALLLIGKIPAISFDPVLSLKIDGWFLWGVLLFAFVWWINLFNFMDGIDGIAGVQGLLMLLICAGLALISNPSALDDPLWVLMLCIVAAISGFLIYNWPPAKIFMGDVGSTWLAFMIFVLALLTVQDGWLAYSVWLIMSAIFVTDTSMTLIARMLRGESWYSAHRNHAYQRLSRRWQNDRKAGHRAVTLTVVFINLFWLAPLSVVTIYFPSHTWLWLLIAYTPIVICVWLLGAGRPDHA